jgi:hypothetical protein
MVNRTPWTVVDKWFRGQKKFTVMCKVRKSGRVLFVLYDKVNKITVSEHDLNFDAIHEAYDLHHDLLHTPADEVLSEAEVRGFLISIEEQLVKLLGQENLTKHHKDVLGMLHSVTSDALDLEMIKHGIDFRNR